MLISQRRIDDFGMALVISIGWGDARAKYPVSPFAGFTPDEVEVRFLKTESIS